MCKNKGVVIRIKVGDERYEVDKKKKRTLMENMEQILGKVKKTV